MLFSILEFRFTAHVDVTLPGSPPGRGVATIARSPMTAPSQGPLPAGRTRAAKKRSRRTTSPRPHLRRAALEALEPRTLLAVLPQATVQPLVTVSTTSRQGYESSP